MIFNEIYGCYYNVVAKILSLAVEGELTEKKMREIASEYAFEESALTILPALRKQQWQLLDEHLETPILQAPTMPMTTLERRWLKTLLMDPRIMLFLPLESEEEPAEVLASLKQGLEEVEPLFLPSEVVYFDRYQDGDPYEEASYIQNFHRIRRAIQEHRKLRILYENGQGQEKIQTLEPLKLEYSDKEDKFRLLGDHRHNTVTMNLARIHGMEELEESFPEDVSLAKRKRRGLTFELTDEKGALDRAMMQFAHYKKGVERLEDRKYRVSMEYDVEDETDVLIQIMSFGTLIRVIEPLQVREELKSRIKKQLDIIEMITISQNG